MKTAMQDLIEKLEEKKDLFKSDGKKSDRNIRGTYVVAIMVAKKLLEKEKKQIIEARQDGSDSTYNNCESGCGAREILEGSNEEYYIQTFKTLNQ